MNHLMLSQRLWDKVQPLQLWEQWVMSRKEGVPLSAGLLFPSSPPPSQTQKTRNHTKEFCCELTVPGKLHKGKQTPMDRNVPSKSILIPHFRTQTPQKIIFSNVPAAATTVTGPLKLPSGLQLHYLRLDSQKLKLFPMLMWDRRVPLPNTN